MTGSKRWVTILALAATAVSPATAWPQASAGIQSVFAAGFGNRALAMGSAFVAAADDASALFWNPAGLAEMRRPECQVAQSNGLGLGLRQATLAVGVPDWRWGTGALSIRTFGVGGLEQRDERNTLISRDLSDQELEIALGYAKPLGRALSIGGAIKAQNHSVAGLGATGVGADVGVRMLPGLWFASDARWADQLILGFAIRNLIAPSLRLDREAVTDPTAIRTGFAWRTSMGVIGSVIAAVDVEKVSTGGMALRSGVEMRPSPPVALRTGIAHGQITAGMGYSWRRFSFDYAYQDNPVASEHRMGLSFAFGRNVDESRATAQRQEDEKLQARLEEAYGRRHDEQITQLLARAEAARAAGRHDEALEILGSARTLAPDDGRVRQFTGTCLHEKADGLMSAGDFTGAALVYDMIVAFMPGDSAAASGAHDARIASDAHAQRSSELRDHFAQALDAFGEGRLVAARLELVALVTAAPSDSDAVHMLRRTEVAIARAVMQAEDRADEAIKAGKVDEALAAIKTAEALDPTSPGIAARRAECGRLLKRQESPRAVVTKHAPSPAPVAKAPSMDPAELDRLYRRGVVAQGNGQADEAIRCWEVVQAASPGYRGVDESLIREYLTRGMDAFAEGRLGDAIQDWERVIRVHPDDARALGYLDRAREQAARRRQILGATR